MPRKKKSAAAKAAEGEVVASAAAAVEGVAKSNKGEVEAAGGAGSGEIKHERAAEQSGPRQQEHQQREQKNHAFWHGQPVKFLEHN